MALDDKLIFERNLHSLAEHRRAHSDDGFCKSFGHMTRHNPVLRRHSRRALHSNSDRLSRGCLQPYNQRGRLQISAFRQLIKPVSRLSASRSPPLKTSTHALVRADGLTVFKAATLSKGKAVVTTVSRQIGASLATLDLSKTDIEGQECVSRASSDLVKTHSLTFFRNPSKMASQGPNSKSYWH